MSEIAPIEWLISDLCTTIIDSSPQELEQQYNKLVALAEAIQDRTAERKEQDDENEAMGMTFQDWRSENDHE